MTIAIDFGTERTKLAYIDNSQPRMMHLGVSGYHIPTLFYLGQNGSFCFGDDAADYLEVDPAGVITVLKRKMQNPFVRANHQKIPPVDLISWMFRTLRERSQRELPVFSGREVDSVMLTIPAAYGPSDRKILAKACRDAGFNEIGFVPEPVAAARAWAATTGGAADTIIVFDCGGGTIDWACLHRNDGDFAIVPECPPGGNTRIGGHDVDHDILNHVLDQLGYTSNEDEIENRLSSYLSEARKMKEMYCRSGALRPLRINNTMVELDSATMDQLLQSRFVEQACQDLEEFVTNVREKLSVASPTVLLVGGSSHVKGLEEAIKERCNVPVARWDQAEYAIVLGALQQPGRTPAAPSSSTSTVSNPNLIPEEDGSEQVEAVAVEAVKEVQSIMQAVLTHAQSKRSGSTPKEVEEFIKARRQEEPAFSLMCEEMFRIVWRTSDPINVFVFALNAIFQASSGKERTQAVKDFGEFLTGDNWPDIETLIEKQRDAFVTFMCDIVQTFAEEEIAAYPELAEWERRFSVSELWRDSLKKQWIDNSMPMRPEYIDFQHHIQETVRRDWSQKEKIMLSKSYNIGGWAMTLGKTGALAAGGILLGGLFGTGLLYAGAKSLFSGPVPDRDADREMRRLNEQLQKTQEMAIAYCEKMEKMIGVVFTSVMPLIAQTYQTCEEFCRDAANRGINLEEMERKSGIIARDKLDQDSIGTLCLVFENLKENPNVSSETRAQLYGMMGRSGYPLTKEGLIDVPALQIEIATQGNKKIKQSLECVTRTGIDWHILNSIPESKLTGAINGYAKNLNLNAVLALHDSTFWGGGGTGYLILWGGIVSSDAIDGNEHASSTWHFLSWNEIEKCDVVKDEWILQPTNNRPWVNLPLGYSIKDAGAARKALQDLLSTMQNKA